MKPIKRLIEEYDKITQGLEFPQKVRYNEDNDEEEIILPKQEYAIVMSTLET